MTEIYVFKSNVKEKTLGMLTKLVKMVLENRNRISSRLARMEVVRPGCCTYRTSLEEDPA